MAAVTLWDLERTLDPFVAAQVYNNEYNPLTRLPEEVLLRILHYASEDVVALFCLRRVSRTFRRLVDEPSLWLRHDMLPTHSSSPLFLTENISSLPRHLSNRLRKHLRDDELCDNCKISLGYPVRGQPDNRFLRMIRNLGANPSRNDQFRCKFRSLIDNTLRMCIPCGEQHDMHAFSRRDHWFFNWFFKGFFKAVPRVCLGYEGAVKLCDDVQIQWEDLEEQISQWREWRDTEPLDWQACLDSFSKGFFRAMPRVCLGYEGAVKLCDHVQIRWEDIEEHISQWRDQKPLDWEACLDSFSKVCEHPSHDTRCTSDGALTWPRARLRRGGPPWFNIGFQVTLSLEWEPHSGIEAFTPTPHKDRWARASELRALFRRQRDGPADTLFPSYPSDPLPEMACFGPTAWPTPCTCVYYEMGGTETPEKATPTESTVLLDDLLPFQCSASHQHNRGYGTGRNDQVVDISSHFPLDGSERRCLVTSYKRDIFLFSSVGVGKIRPSHAWFHAMDPETYPHPSAAHVLPECKDRKCMNYYRGPAANPCRMLVHRGDWRGHYR